MATLQDVILASRRLTASMQHATAQAATASARTQRQRAGRGTTPTPAPSGAGMRLDTSRGPLIRHSCNFRITSVR